MLALLVVLFNNLVQPLFILLVIPLSFIGVIIGHIVLGYSLSVMSLFGVVALTGIVINDGVVLLRGCSVEHWCGHSRLRKSYGSRVQSIRMIRVQFVMPRRVVYYGTVNAMVSSEALAHSPNASPASTVDPRKERFKL